MAPNKNKSTILRLYEIELQTEKLVESWATQEIDINSLKDTVKNQEDVLQSITGSIAQVQLSLAKKPIKTEIDKLREIIEKIKIVASMLINEEISKNQFHKLIYLIESTNESNQLLAHNIINAKCKKIKDE